MVSVAYASFNTVEIFKSHNKYQIVCNSARSRVSCANHEDFTVDSEGPIRTIRRWPENWEIRPAQVFTRKLFFVRTEK